MFLWLIMVEMDTIYFRPWHPLFKNKGDAQPAWLSFCFFIFCVCLFTMLVCFKVCLPCHAITGAKHSSLILVRVALFLMCRHWACGASHIAPDTSCFFF